jgi:hypothetical protein
MKVGETMLERITSASLFRIERVEGACRERVENGVLYIEREWTGHIIVWSSGTAEQLEAMAMEAVRPELAALTDEARELCYAIEKLPASEEQTALSIKASALHQKLQGFGMK